MRVGSVQGAKWVALPTLDQKVQGLNPVGCRIQLMTVWQPFVNILPLSCHNLNDVEREIKLQIIIIHKSGYPTSIYPSTHEYVCERTSFETTRWIFGLVFFKNLSFKIAMSGRAGVVLG